MHAHTHTEQFTGGHVNLLVNNHTHRPYDLLPSHYSVKKQPTVGFSWYMFWPEIALTKITYGNMHCHDAEFIYLSKVGPFLKKVLA
jgi:hypothetical protein